MTDRTLRAMYAGMAKARVQASGSRTGLARAASRDVACFAAGLVGLRKEDLVFGCRDDSVIGCMRAGSSLPRLADGVGRLYAAAGAAMTFRERDGRVAMVFCERHEADGGAWAEALKVVAELPVVVAVLPRWKGPANDELCPVARRSGVPGIAVDAADAIALYRVAQESLVRARMGGGAALMEGVWFPQPGRAEEDALDGLGAYLRQRGIVRESWLRRARPDRASR